MKRSLKVVGILLGIISLVCITSAIAVGNIAITPSGDLVSGVTKASADFIINFPSSGGYSFDSSNALSMDTDLDNATWTTSLVLDGQESDYPPQTGKNIRISGWELSYPSRRTVSLKVRLNGVAPLVDTSQEKILIRVRELSSNNAAITGSQVVKTKMVINPATLGASVSSEAANLTALRTKIDELAGRGVNVAAAESKYGQANTLLQQAQKSSDTAQASTKLSQATKIINEIESEVVKLDAGDAISRAESSVGQTEEIISYFKTNKSMSDDPRLMPILTKWEIAADKLSTAKDLNSQGKYDEAAAVANEAATKGDQVLTEAQALKEKVDSSPLAALGGIGSAFAGSIIKIVIIIVVVILVVVGILLFRRRRRWDELG